MSHIPPLPQPIDALAAAANLAAKHPGCAIAQEAARYLKAYGLLQNAKIAERVEALRRREEAAREMAEARERADGTR